MTNDHAHLPRLNAQHYAGQAAVHWVMNVNNRQTGWLGDGFHNRFRELLLHAQASCELACPVYCVMPDHIHLLLLGITERSHQLKALRFLHRYVNLFLNPIKLQKQNFDHVLRLEEREKTRSKKRHFISWKILFAPGW
ncbi:MAG: transposase [Lentisphaerae bacterium]|nr:transposase [Lentisphaerota bacterium]